ncbi:MAG TPA: ribosome maturation factor RimM [Clostridiales bacterium]|nr:ribosome maturation factor RimM [Clostridiales bacterium]
MNDYLRVGVITSTHGLKGEVKVFPTTDDLKRFESLKKVILEINNDYIELEIVNVKYFKQMVILKFKDINDINDVEKYKGMDLLVTRENAIKLEADEYFISDLLNCKVITDENQELGIIKEVLTSRANDVYVVETPDKKEILIPVIKDCILNIDINNKIIQVHLIKGLI